MGVHQRLTILDETQIQKPKSLTRACLKPVENHQLCLPFVYQINITPFANTVPVEPRPTVLAFSPDSFCF
jgi:hypothetical protein